MLVHDFCTSISKNLYIRLRNRFSTQKSKTVSVQVVSNSKLENYSILFLASRGNMFISQILLLAWFTPQFKSWFFVDLVLTKALATQHKLLELLLKFLSCDSSVCQNHFFLLHVVVSEKKFLLWAVTKLGAHKLNKENVVGKSNFWQEKFFSWWMLERKLFAWNFYSEEKLR